MPQGPHATYELWNQATVGVDAASRHASLGAEEVCFVTLCLARLL